MGDGFDGQADDEIPVFERRCQLQTLLVELAIGNQVQAEALPGVVFVVVESPPENPCGRGLSVVDDLQIG